MKTFSVPVKWVSTGYAMVDAESVEDAIERIETCSWDEITGEDASDFEFNLDDVEEVDL